ncbi:MAG: PIN domain-containing protein [Ginsengibacter sp.]
MYKILIDTCVWLDLAKDPNQVHLISVLEDLIQSGEIILIVPEIIVTEFNRNKDRIVKESHQSLSGNIKRVKDLVYKVSNPKKAKLILNELSEVDFKLPKMGEAVLDSVLRIEKIIKTSLIIPTSNDVLIRAAKRGVNVSKPFQAKKNSINDAIIIETYFECLQDKSNKGWKFLFITHNKNDFSAINQNEKKPHPDLQGIFSKIKSRYYIKLSEALKHIQPNLITDKMIEEEFDFEPRSLNEILKAEDELTNKIWYNRHQIRVEKIENGIIKIVTEGGVGNDVILKSIWEGAKKSAKKVEKKYGSENLSWDDFEWGMLNGKLSALRWVIGEDWDELYT